MLALDAVDDGTVLSPLPDVDGGPTPGERRQQARAAERDAEVTAQLEAVIGYLFGAVESGDEFITPGQGGPPPQHRPRCGGPTDSAGHRGLAGPRPGVSGLRRRRRAPSPLVRRARPELTTGRPRAEASYGRCCAQR